jgi:uncharacterized membrane protein
VRRVLVIAALGAGCHAEDQFEEALCPEEGTELTYENFGRDLVGSECQSCHATGAADRRGAPSHVTFDDLEEVRDWAPRIYERSAGANVSMPPGPVDLDLAVREDLAEWLACGAPGGD